MKHTDIVTELIRLLEERFPGGYNYVPKLSEILEVHPKTIFRKLHGDSQFTIEEIVKISKRLDISMCSLLNCSEHRLKHPMEIYLHDFSIAKKYQAIVHLTSEAYQFAAKSNSSTYMVATNTIPDLIYADHPWIARFSYLKWLYFNKGSEAMIPLSDITLTPEIREIHQRYTDSITSMKRSIYIFHMDMMKHLADEITFFFRTKHITKEEIKSILEEFHHALDQLEEVCVKGFLPLNRKEIDVFYSTILFANNMTVINSDNIQIGIVYTYFLNPIITKSAATFNIVKGWFHSWIRSATMISMSGAKDRHVFFTHQRETLYNLWDTISNS